MKYSLEESLASLGKDGKDLVARWRDVFDYTLWKTTTDNAQIPADGDEGIKENERISAVSLWLNDDATGESTSDGMKTVSELLTTLAGHFQKVRWTLEQDETYYDKVKLQGKGKGKETMTKSEVSPIPDATTLQEWEELARGEAAVVEFRASTLEDQSGETIGAPVMIILPSQVRDPNFSYSEDGSLADLSEIKRLADLEFGEVDIQQVATVQEWFEGLGLPKSPGGTKSTRPKTVIDRFLREQLDALKASNVDRTEIESFAMVCATAEDIQNDKNDRLLFDAEDLPILQQTLMALETGQLLIGGEQPELVQGDSTEQQENDTVSDRYCFTKACTVLRKIIADLDPSTMPDIGHA